MRNLRDALVDGAKFCTVMRPGPNFIMLVQNLGAPSKKFKRPKTFKIWSDFGRFQTSAANISGMGKDIRNRTSTFFTATPPCWVKKLGELWSAN